MDDVLAATTAAMGERESITSLGEDGGDPDGLGEEPELLANGEYGTPKKLSSDAKAYLFVRRKLEGRVAELESQVQALEHDNDKLGRSLVTHKVKAQQSDAQKSALIPGFMRVMAEVKALRDANEQVRREVEGLKVSYTLLHVVVR